MIFFMQVPGLSEVTFTFLALPGRRHFAAPPQANTMAALRFN